MCTINKLPANEVYLTSLQYQKKEGLTSNRKVDIT